MRVERRKGERIGGKRRESVLLMCMCLPSHLFPPLPLCSLPSLFFFVFTSPTLPHIHFLSFPLFQIRVVCWRSLDVPAMDGNVSDIFVDVSTVQYCTVHSRPRYARLPNYLFPLILYFHLILSCVFFSAMRT